MAASVWKGHLTFGLVSFPVVLFTAAREEGISFNLLHKKDGSRIKEVTFCKAEDQPISREELVKGYQYAKDKYIVVEDDDIKKVAPSTAKVMEILEFVKATEVDPIYLEKSYYLGPGEGGEKPYSLFWAAMRKAEFCGVAKLAMHNREHIVILRPGAKGVVLHSMYYQEEVRQSQEVPANEELVKPKELGLAVSLMNSLAEPFEPGKYEDAYKKNLQEMIDAKLAGHKVVAAPEPRMAPVIDIVEALQQSLARKKPPRSTQKVERISEPKAPAKKRIPTAG